MFLSDPAGECELEEGRNGSSYLIYFQETQDGSGEFSGPSGFDPPHFQNFKSPQIFTEIFSFLSILCAMNFGGLLAAETIDDEILMKGRSRQNLLRGEEIQNPSFTLETNSFCFSDKQFNAPFLYRGAYATHSTPLQP
jgi:hypothetical protein